MKVRWLHTARNSTIFGCCIRNKISISFKICASAKAKLMYVHQDSVIFSPACVPAQTLNRQHSTLSSCSFVL